MQRIITHKMDRLQSILLGIITILILSGCDPNLPPEVAIEYRKLPKTLDFNMDVKPILSDKCFLCHGPDQAKQQADLRLDEEVEALMELKNNPGKFAIKPGSLNKSEVFHRIISGDPDFIMPSLESNLKLSAKEKAILVKWIEDGAEYKPHWAFLKPTPQKPPKVKDGEWIQNPIDQFILQRLEEEDIKSFERSNKRTTASSTFIRPYRTSTHRRRNECLFGG